MKIETAKVLVIDDDRVMRSYVGNLLNQLGITHVEEATNGQQGLAVAGRFRPDMVLSDIHMSPMNGHDFVKGMRAHPIFELRKTPIFFMSADGSTGTFNESVQSGIRGYIIKPPTKHVLRAKLEQVLLDCRH
ncbi:MAG: response regulator [Anaerolineales bacterium]|nr:response regulator [Anaerolineales bacterium]